MKIGCNKNNEKEDQAEKESLEKVPPNSNTISMDFIRLDVGGDFPIHRMIYKKDFQNLVYYFKQNAFTPDDLN